MSQGNMRNMVSSSAVSEANFFVLSNNAAKNVFLVVCDVATDAIFVVRYLASKSNQSNLYFSENIELSFE